MNITPTETQQTIGNLCVAIATLIYAAPVQYLISELSRKSGPDNGAGAILGLIILVPMWLLLGAALMILAASGGFDWLRLSGFALYALIAFSAVSMAAVSSFLIFEPLPHGARLFSKACVHLFPVLTILLALFCLNPRLTMGLPIKSVLLPWTGIAALTATFCGGYIAYNVYNFSARQIVSIAYSARREYTGAFNRDPKVIEEMVANIAKLDPQTDFYSLTRFLNAKDSVVYEAAFARLRSDPNLVTNLISKLTHGSAETRASALAVLEVGAFAPDEQKQLAEPARTAMEEIAFYEHEHLNYKPKSEHKRLRKEGLRLFNAVAEKLAGAGVDFAPAIDAYSHAFDPN